MQGAERGLRRLEAEVGIAGPEALARILESLKLDSMERIDNLDTLKCRRKSNVGIGCFVLKPNLGPMPSQSAVIRPEGVLDYNLH